MTQELDLKELRKVAEAATPGPWHWSGNTKNNQLYLATWIKGAGRCQVMDFVRWGMHSAAPRFLDDESLMMQSAKDLVVYEVARNQGLPDETPSNDPRVYRQDIVDVRHPNARFLAAANPEVILALLTQLEQAQLTVERAKAVVALEKRNKGIFAARAIKAEAQVARVRDMAEEMGEAIGFDRLVHGQEAEYPVSYFRDKLEETLDGEPNE